MAPSHVRSLLFRTSMPIALAVVTLGCGGGDRMALATADPVSTEGAVEVRVECSREVDVAVDPTGGVDGLPLVTARGVPVAGRCTVPLSLDLPEGSTSYQDAATGMVVDLPDAAPAGDAP